MNPLRKTVTFLLGLYFDLHIEGRENIPEGEGVVIASNHRGYADPVFNTMPMKKRVRYMAKEELFKNPLFARFITSLGAFPVRRGAGDMALLNDCAEMVKSGQNLVIYPEGTRSKTGKLGRLKTGVVIIASKANADILPMGINYEGEKLRFRTKVTLRVGKVIPASEVHAEVGDRKSINAAKQRILSALKEVVDEPVDTEIPKNGASDNSDV